MKKIFISIFATLFAVAAFGQLKVDTYPINSANGMENLIVEQIDASTIGAGYVAYRVYLDLADGVEVISVFGEQAVGIPISITSSTSFYNDGSANVVYGNLLQAALYALPGYENTQYDTYVTLGGAATNRIGVPLSVDANGYVAGTPISTASGDEANIAFPGGADYVPNAIVGGGWNAPGGSSALGYGTDNILYIAQFTTDGDLNFQFTALTTLGAPTASDVLSYSSVEENIAPTAEITDPTSGNVFSDRPLTFLVAVDDPNNDPAFDEVTTLEYRINSGSPVTSALLTEITIPAQPEGPLTLEVRATDEAGLVGNWSSVYSYTVVREQIAPEVTLTADDYEVLEGEEILFTASITDGSLAVNSIVWTIDGTVVTGANAATYNWTSDVVGATVPVRVDVSSPDGSAFDEITVKVISGDASYELGSVEEFCYESNTVCIPVKNIVAFGADVIGFDMDITYNPAMLVPTGQVIVLDNPGGANMDNTEIHTNIVTPGVMHLSIALDNTSSVDDVWSSIDRDLFCVQFAKTSNWTPTSSETIGAVNIIESYRNSVSDTKVASAGTYTTTVDNNYYGFVKFWADYSPLYSDDPLDLDIETFINSTSEAYSVTTAADGSFAYDITRGTEMEITKDVANAARESALMTVFNGYDGYLTSQLLVNDARFQPTAIQMIAMDVNRDGVVSAGDLSQINQRGTRMITYFRAEGVLSGADGVDWLFINEKQLLDSMDMRMSATFPEDDGQGYSKYRVPEVPATFDLAESFGNDLSCPVMIDGNTTYLGILLGDVDGTYTELAPEGRLKTLETASVVFDLSNATYEEDFVDVPVQYVGEEVVKSMSFGLEYNRAEMSLQTIASLDGNVEALYNDDVDYLYLVSYSLEGYNVDEPVFSMRFYAPNGVDTDDFSEVAGFINGDEVATVVTMANENATAIQSFETGLKIYPNPATEYLNIEVSENVNMEIIDVQGRVLVQRTNVIGVERIDINEFKAGVYMLKLSNDDHSVVKRVVIQK